MKLLGLLSAFLFLSNFTFSAAVAAEIGGSISFQGDTVHLEMSGRSNWTYDVKKIQRNGKYVMQMSIEPISDVLVKQLESFKSAYVTSVKVDKLGQDGKYNIEFVLSANNIEAFDYLTDSPSRLIVDFYPDPNTPIETPKKSALKEKASNNNVESSEETVASLESTTVSKGKEKPRKPATTDVLVVADGQKEPSKEVRSGIFDGGDPDYERFTVKDYEIKDEALIASQDNYYIPFPMVMAESETWEKVKIAPTLFEIKPKDTEENKMARLLMTLFEKKRPLVFLKTVKWFHEKYPQSEYKEMIEFMTADVQFSLWEEKHSPADYDQAMLAYKKLVQKYPTNPLSERISVRLGYIALERKDAVAALRYFNDHIGNPNFKDTSLSKDLARLGTGLAFHTLNRYDDAFKIYDDVEKTSKYKDIQVEAAYRKGDVYTQKGDFLKNMPEEHRQAWATAVKEYQIAQKKFPEARTSFPNADYNQAEAFFWQKKYPQALDAYRDFVKRFPSHEHAPFAMTRIGELMEILGADSSRVMGAYLETYFRYGESSQAAIARMRMLSAKMKGMKPKEADAAMKEITTLSKKLDLPEMPQFTTVVIADGLTSRKEYEKAADNLIKYYQANPVTADRKLLTKRIVNNINSRIVDLVEDGQFISALKTHSDYWDKWLKNSERLDTKFYIGKAFEDAGVDKQAEDYYKEVLNRSYSLKGSKAEKELAIVEKIPSEDRLSLRLASVYEKQNKMKQSYDMLKNIKQPEKMSELEQIERVGLAVRLLENRGENESAIRYLTELLKTWKGQPSLVAGPFLKLAELEAKTGRFEDAIKSLDRIDVMMKDSNKVDESIHLASLQKKAEILFGQGKSQQVIPVYESMLERYEAKKSLGSIRYKLGEIYFAKGDLAKAANTWKDFKGDKSKFWQDLAQEKLKDAEWADGYKKYIKRIPAMSESEESQ